MKKKEVKVEDVFVPSLEVEIHNEPKVGKLDLDFGRADLNKLKDKVNEIIDNM